MRYGTSSRSYKAATRKAQALLKKTHAAHTVWWNHENRRYWVSCTECVQRLTRAGKIGGKSRVIFTFDTL